MWKSANSYLESFAINVLKCGPIPKHLAIIMDGNRRYARKNQMETFTGHKMGFETLSEILRLCADLGISEVSVYAFSIENFKRPKTEVDALMGLAEDKLEELQRSDLINKHEVSVRLVGDISLLPHKVQVAMARLVHHSRNNKKGILNICFAYTSRNEMMNSVRSMACAVEEGRLQPSDISEELFEECLYEKSRPDVLIRTSGETRLSDFLLWQSSFSLIQFFQVLWPEFSLWHIFYAVLMYQRNHDILKQQRQEYDQQLLEFQQKSNCNPNPSRVQAFLQSQREKNERILRSILESSLDGK